MSERIQPLEAVHLDGQAITFAHGVLVTAADVPCDDWVVILLDVSAGSMPLIQHDHRLVIRTGDGLLATGEVRVSSRERRREYTRLAGVGLLRAVGDQRTAA